MTVITTSPSGASAGGYEATVSVNIGTQPRGATAGGYAALVFGVPPTPGSTPDALRLEIVTVAGTQLVNDLVARRDLSFTVEHNGSGMVSFETDLDAVGGMDSALLDPNNLVRVHFGDLSGWPYGVAEGFMAAAPPQKDDSGRWTIAIPCLGSADVLDLGVLWPPAGASGDTREFSYTAGQTGPAWVPDEWGAPSGTLVKSSFRWKHRWPRGWPESKAKWIWSSSPEKSSAEGERQFVGQFTLAAKSNVHFYVAGDDNLKLYLNGARIKAKGRNAWHKTASFIRTLEAGTYTLASSVSNMPGGDNKSGFICAVAKLKANGARDSWLLRSNSDTFQIKTAAGYFAQVPLPPDGWYPAAVLYQHIAEAAARGVAFHSGIVQTFSATADSYGSAWTEKGPAEYDIGISGAELADKVRAAGADVAMLPGLQLCAWRSRGFDLSARVVISTPLGVGWQSKTWSRVRTVGLTHHESGWTVTAGDSTTAAEYGRRELTVSGGGVDGDTQADIFATRAMTTAASPEETIEATITAADMVPDPDTGVAAPMPFRDFNVADIITVETVGGYQQIKVMSIKGDEQTDKSVQFTIAGYPV